MSETATIGRSSAHWTDVGGGLAPSLVDVPPALRAVVLEAASVLAGGTVLAGSDVSWWSLFVQSAIPEDFVLVAVVMVALVSIHVFSPGLEFVESMPRTPLVSFGSGVSVAYVFVHLIPQISEFEDAVLRGEAAFLPIDLPVYLVALAGFVTFYALEGYGRRCGRRPAERDQDVPETEAAMADGERPVTAAREYAPAVFWVHVGSFAGYNAVLGHLVIERALDEASGIVLFAAAIALHLFVIDQGLREHYRGLYHRVGRWILAGAVLFGAISGVVFPIPRGVFALVLSFVAGAIVLNSIKEELPGHCETRFSAFIFGVALYALLLQAV